MSLYGIEWRERDYGLRRKIPAFLCSPLWASIYHIFFSTSWNTGNIYIQLQKFVIFSNRFPYFCRDLQHVPGKLDQLQKILPLRLYLVWFLSLRLVPGSSQVWWVQVFVKKIFTCFLHITYAAYIKQNMFGEGFVPGCGNDWNINYYYVLTYYSGSAESLISWWFMKNYSYIVI